MTDHGRATLLADEISSLTDGVSADQEFTVERPCPVCGGSAAGGETRCDGYMSRDRSWAYCTREYRAVDLEGPSCSEGERLDGDDPRTGSLASDPRELPEATRWLVWDRLPLGGTSLLIGSRGSGKSRLARELALCVARGRPWLGSPTHQGGVLYVDLERRANRARDGFERERLAAGEPVHFLSDAPVGDLLAAIRERVRLLRVELIVVDPLEPLLGLAPGRRKNERAHSLEALFEIAESASCHLLLVERLDAHRKASEASGLLQESSRPVDTVLMLSTDGLQLRSVQRLGPSLREPLLLASPPGSHPKPAAAPPTPEGRLEDELLAVLRSARHPLDERELRLCLAARASDIEHALTLLREKGKVLTCGQGSWEDPLRFAACSPVGVARAHGWLRQVATPVPVG